MSETVLFLCFIAFSPAIGALVALLFASVGSKDDEEDTHHGR